MKAYQNKHDTEHVVTPGAKVPYEAPELTIIGKVEQLTALLSNGTPDLLSHGNIL